jgi:hypothetical protein
MFFEVLHRFRVFDQKLDGLANQQWRSDRKQHCCCKNGVSTPSAEMRKGDRGKHGTEPGCTVPPLHRVSAPVYKKRNDGQSRGNQQPPVHAPAAACFRVQAQCAQQQE